MESSETALISLTAFIGAVFGSIGCFAAASTGDIVLGILAATGAVSCARIWRSFLQR